MELLDYLLPPQQEKERMEYDSKYLFVVTRGVKKNVLLALALQALILYGWTDGRDCIGIGNIG